MRQPKNARKFKRHYTRREMEQILKDNGWRPVRQRGSHRIYENYEGDHISIGTCKYNEMIFQRLAKKYNMILTK